VAIQFVHERLAEAHDFVVGLAFRIEVTAALAAADGETGQRVLEDLFETEELDDAGVDAGVETQTALVWADGRVVLDAVAFVDLYMALVIDPGDTEDDLALGLDDAFDDVVLLVLRVFVQQGAKGGQYFFNGLIKLQFSRAGSLEFGDGIRYVWHDAPQKIIGYVCRNLVDCQSFFVVIKESLIDGKSIFAPE
jgi:hypothetical protein